MSEGLAYREAIAEAIRKDVLFFHIDCGAFTPYRWNPDLSRVEYWHRERWNPIQMKEDCGAKDWVVSDRPRRDYEVIVYKD